MFDRLIEAAHANTVTAGITLVIATGAVAVYGPVGLKRTGASTAAALTFGIGLWIFLTTIAALALGIA
jgi:hypothetical protein